MTTIAPGSKATDGKVDEGVPMNLLMISNKRHRAFYERAARELMASGHDEIQLSALGDAVPLAVQLANGLQDKQAATLVKIETKLVEFSNETSVSSTGAPTGRKGSSAPSRASGVSIIMRKHPAFKGTRIVPGYVYFCPEVLTTTAAAFPPNPDRWLASVNAACGNDVFDMKGNGKAFTEILSAAGQSVESYAELHKFLLTEALASNKTETEMGKIRFVGELEGVKKFHSGLKAAFCRVCPKLKEEPKYGATGTVFVDIIAEGNFPHGNEKNCCVVHVVAPKGSDFPDAKDFLSAVTLTANNLMNALCDFNGYAKRHHGDSKLPRLGLVRIPLISGDASIRHPQASAADVAKAILKGLDEGYHFGPAPRLQFLDAEGAFKQVWCEESGQTTEGLQVTEGTFLSPKTAEKNSKQ